MGPNSGRVQILFVMELQGPIVFPQVSCLCVSVSNTQMDLSGLIITGKR